MSYHLKSPEFIGFLLWGCYVCWNKTRGSKYILKSMNGLCFIKQLTNIRSPLVCLPSFIIPYLISKAICNLDYHSISTSQSLSTISQLTLNYHLHETGEASRRPRREYRLIRWSSLLNTTTPQRLRTQQSISCYDIPRRSVIPNVLATVSRLPS